MRSFLLLPFLLLLVFVTYVLPASAQDFAREQLNASPRHHEWVEVSSGDRTVYSFVAYPETDATPNDLAGLPSARWRRARSSRPLNACGNRVNIFWIGA